MCFCGKVCGDRGKKEEGGGGGGAVEVIGGTSQKRFMTETGEISISPRVWGRP